MSGGTARIVLQKCLWISVILVQTGKCFFIWGQEPQAMNFTFKLLQSVTTLLRLRFYSKQLKFSFNHIRSQQLSIRAFQGVSLTEKSL